MSKYSVSTFGRGITTYTAPSLGEALKLIRTLTCTHYCVMVEAPGSNGSLLIWADGSGYYMKRERS